MQTKYGFVYVWRDRKHKRYYVGSHWGREDDGYVCSSRWMLAAINRRPNDFKRRVIKRGFIDRAALYAEERRWLSMIKPEEIKQGSKSRYYNLNIKGAGHWVAFPDTRSIREKISAANKASHKGMTPFWAIEANRGRKHSQERKDRQIAAWKSNPANVERARATGQARRGSKASPESIEKMLETRRRNGTRSVITEKTREMSRTVEALAKRSLSMAGKNTGKRPVATCPHCGKIGGDNAMRRYHFNNCREAA